jgi:hypothetical protein
MKRALLTSLGWVLAVALLWLPLLLLDVYWNLISWHPKWDSTVLLLFVWIVVVLGGMRLLAGLTRDPISHSTSLLLGLGLLCLGVYACPPEPLSSEWFGRLEASPAWYRALRLVVMAFPLWLQLIGRRTPLQAKAGIPGH